MNKDIASVFEWFAQESIHIAEQANEPKRRESLANLALLWAIAAAEHRASPEGAVKTKAICNLSGTLLFTSAFLV
jgi:hypothetical protein